MSHNAFSPPCEICLTADASSPIATATHFLVEERDGKRNRIPACARHAAAAQRYRIAHRIPMHAPLRPPVDAPSAAAERVH
jgi:hypothetical protein